MVGNVILHSKNGSMKVIPNGYDLHTFVFHTNGMKIGGGDYQTIKRINMIEERVIIILHKVFINN